MTKIADDNIIRDEEKKIGRKKKFRSLCVQLPFVFIMTLVIVLVAVIFIIYHRFENHMVDEYTKMAQGASRMMSTKIDGDKVEWYIKHPDSKEYHEIITFMSEIRKDYPEILYIYIYKFSQKGGLSVFDFNDDIGDAEYTPPGEYYEVDEPFASQIDRIMTGKTLPAYTVHTRDNEYLLSYLHPVFDSKGRYACSIGVDFSLAEMHKENVRFIFSMLLFLLLIVSGVLVFDIYYIRHMVTKPLDRLATTLDNFSYETDNDKYTNLSSLEELNITTQDEIGIIYQSLLATLKESFFFSMNLQNANDTLKKVKKKMSHIKEEAITDPLTGMLNKRAYEKITESLDERIKNGRTDFAVVMLDINNLKYINDTFGHEKGDVYIKDCANVFKSIYSKSEIYRIGGDEFVVVLMDEDYDNRNEKTDNIITLFNALYSDTNKKPWERLSSSVGMAEHMEGETYEDTFNRADASMYEFKQKFKAKYGSYR